MICTLTARRLNPGAYEVVLSFGLFDGTAEQLRAAQQRLRRGDQVDRIGPHVEQVLLDGSYEVVEELSP
jgi:hypothetical protein